MKGGWGEGRGRVGWGKVGGEGWRAGGWVGSRLGPTGYCYLTWAQWAALCIFIHIERERESERYVCSFLFLRVLHLINDLLLDLFLDWIGLEWIWVVLDWPYSPGAITRPKRGFTGNCTRNSTTYFNLDL